MNEETVRLLIQNLPMILTGLAAVLATISGLVLGVLQYRKTNKSIEVGKESIEVGKESIAASKHNTAKIDAAKIQVENLEQTFNGKSDQLLEATEKLAFSQGKAQGKLEQKADNDNPLKVELVEPAPVPVVVVEDEKTKEV